MLAGRPKTAGASAVGSAFTMRMKSSCFVLIGSSAPGTSLRAKAQRSRSERRLRNTTRHEAELFSRRRLLCGQHTLVEALVCTMRTESSDCEHERPKRGRGER